MAKVMTAYVVLDLIDSGKVSRDKMVTVSRATWEKWNGSNGGSTMFLRAGERVSVDDLRSGEHTSELQSLMRISYAVFCLKKKIAKSADNTSDKVTHNNTDLKYITSSQHRHQTTFN